jgi:SPP1 gp7 family putative phage head morphogenesis protein
MADYNTLRRQELKHIQESMKSDAAYKGHLTRLYNRVEKDIAKDITADLEGFAFRDGLSMTEARKIASKTDVQAFQDTAKRYVETRDFSDRANRELRRYNVTMRTNRLELLEAKVNLLSVDMANEEEGLLQRHLAKEALKEYERQAGILGMTVPSDRQLERMFNSVLTAQFEGATFSDRIWANQAELRDGINRTLERTIIRGENPRVAARELRELVRDEFGKKKYAADRIAITESARVQSAVMEQAFKDAGIDQYIWITEPDGCPDCQELDGKIFDVGKGPMPPEPHPNCRCSTSSYVER